MVRLTDGPDMTLGVYRGRKITTTTTTTIIAHFFVAQDEKSCIYDERIDTYAYNGMLCSRTFSFDVTVM